MLPVETTAARPTGTGGGNLSSGVISSSRSEEHTSELQSQSNLVCRLLLEKKKKAIHIPLKPNVTSRQAHNSASDPLPHSCYRVRINRYPYSTAAHRFSHCSV